MKSNVVLTSVLIVIVFMTSPLGTPQNGVELLEDHPTTRETKNDITLEEKSLSSPEVLESTEIYFAGGTHPLRNDRTLLQELPEILLYGTDADDGDLNGFLYDDFVTRYYPDWTINHSWDRDDNCGHPDVAWGDIDGDGKLEHALVADKSLSDFYMCIRDDYDTAFDYSEFTWDNGRVPTVSTGDFDRDGMDEIFFGYDTSPNNVTLWVMDFDGPWGSYPAFPLMEQLNVNYDYQTGRRGPDSATGDFDGDGDDEIVFVLDDGIADLHAFVYDHVNYEYIVMEQLIVDSGTDNIRVATGDVDGNGDDEIIFLGTDESFYSSYANLVGFVYDYDRASGMFTRIKSWGEEDMADGCGSPAVATGDIDRDQKDEIVFFGTDWDECDMNLWIFDDKDSGFAELVHSDENDNIEKGDVACADLDLDGADEIIIAHEINGNDEVGGTIWDRQITVRIYRYKTWEPHFELLGGTVTPSHSANPVLALGDAHMDGVIMEYVEPAEPFSTTSMPRIMDVIAAPPYIAGISQNNEGGCTILGSSESQAETESNSVTMSESARLTFGFGIGGAAKAEISTSLARSACLTRTNTTSFTRSSYYMCGHDDNGVIFAITEFNRYNYTIVSHPTMPDKIGELLTLEIPVKSSVYKYDLSHFTAEYPEYQLERAFSHEIGNASSYPSLADYLGAGAVIEPVWTSGEENVGQGNDKTGVAISVTEQTTTSEQRTITVGFSASVSTGIEILAFAFSAGYTLSFEVGHSIAYSITTGEGYSYTGYVGDIDADEFDEYKFSYGLIVYTYNDTDLGIPYQVVNYFVHGAKPGPSSGPGTVSETSFISVPDLAVLVILSFVITRKARKPPEQGR